MFQPTKSSFSSYFDQPHSFSTFLQSKSTDFAGHDYGNVVYSPLGSTTAETIMEETEVPCKNVSLASAVRCMTGIACSLAAASPASSAPGDGDESSAQPDKTACRFDADADVAAGRFDDDDVENRVQQLFDGNMPDYTNVTVSDPCCKYAPVQI